MSSLKGEFQPLDKYISDAKKYIYKRAPILKRDEDAISYVAYWGMIADSKFDESKNDSRDGYRALYYSFGLRKYFRLRRSKKRSLNNSVLSLDAIKKDKNSTERSFLSKLAAPKIENIQEYTDLINSFDFLSDTQKNVSILYWVHGYTTEEIGEKIGVTKQRVSQHLIKIRELCEEYRKNGRN